MGLPKKRGRFYYANQRIGNVHLRTCLRTGNYAIALAKQKELVTQTLNGKIVTGPLEWTKLLLAEAIDAVIEESAPRLAAKTIKTNKERAQQVKSAIGHIPIRSVDADIIRSYQNRRLKAESAPALSIWNSVLFVAL